MPKLIETKGLPGSGKSRFARERCAADGNTFRVNRDDLRTMLWRKWSGAKEKMLVKLEVSMVRNILDQGFNVIVDDTNLKNDRWSQLAQELGAQYELADFRNVPLRVCVERDRQRPDAVGCGVINNMALRYGLVPWPLDQQIVICDIDGTLADLTHRVHYIKQTPKDHMSFYREVSQDAPMEGTIAWVRELARDFYVVLVSGRPAWVAEETEKWLQAHDVPYQHLFMRHGQDRRDDTIIKGEIADLMPLDRIAFVIDDRPSVIQMWRERGLKVYPVNQELWQNNADESEPAA